MPSSNDFENAVKAEAARLMAEQQERFTLAMQEAIGRSVAALDAAREAVEAERQRLSAEIDAAREAVKQTERDGETLAEAYFAKCRKELVQSTRTHLLRELAYDQLIQGRSEKEVCDWLKVEPEFVEEIITIIDRRAAYRREVFESGRIQLGGNARLRYRDNGRSGTILFESDETTFELWWEFGGGRAMVVIDIPTAESWTDRTRLAADQRDEVLRFIAEQVVADQAMGHAYEIDAGTITILR